MNTGTPGSNTPPNPGITEAQEENESTSFVNILEVYSPPQIKQHMVSIQHPNLAEKMIKKILVDNERTFCEDPCTHIPALGVYTHLHDKTYTSEIFPHVQVGEKELTFLLCLLLYELKFQIS